MTKRDLFAELKQGFDALESNRHGKQTLRTTQVALKPVAKVSAAEVKAIREALQWSQPLFAQCLRTNLKTLQNWEQGRAAPNTQASLLIKLIQRYPDTAQRLQTV